MVQYKIRFNPEAAQEAARAVEWYRHRSGIAAEAFVLEVEAAVNEILSFPEAWPSYRRQYRRRVLARFPYSLVYKISDDTIDIIAVAPDKKRPGYFEAK